MAARRLITIGVCTVLAPAVLGGPRLAVASRVSAPGLRYSYVAGAGEFNRPRITFRVQPGSSPPTAEVTTTDTVPISVSSPCVHPAPANPRTARCTVELTEELPRVDLGDRDDRLTVSGTDPLVLDGPGDDTIFALTSALWANGPGNDTYRGGPGRDLVRRPHGSGADRIYVGAGNDQVYAGSGDDRAYGGPGTDLLYGDAGDDRLYGGTGDDRLLGGLGRDTLFGGSGSDRLDGRLRDFFRG